MLEQEIKESLTDASPEYVEEIASRATALLEENRLEYIEAYEEMMQDPHDESALIRVYFEGGKGQGIEDMLQIIRGKAL